MYIKKKKKNHTKGISPNRTNAFSFSSCLWTTQHVLERPDGMPQLTLGYALVPIVNITQRVCRYICVSLQ
jgi:hypothetical protein